MRGFWRFLGKKNYGELTWRQIFLKNTNPFLCRLQQRKKIKMDLVWIDSTTVILHRLRFWGIKKQNPPWGGEERAEALKIHVGLCQGFLCGACLSASNKLDMTVFNELWARGN